MPHFSAEVICRLLSALTASGCFPSQTNSLTCVRLCVLLCRGIWMENPHIWQWSPLRFCTALRAPEPSLGGGGVFSLCSPFPAPNHHTYTYTQTHTPLNTQQSSLHLTAAPIPPPSSYSSSICLFLTLFVPRLSPELQCYCSTFPYKERKKSLVTAVHGQNQREHTLKRDGYPVCFIFHWARHLITGMCKLYYITMPVINTQTITKTSNVTNRFAFSETHVRGKMCIIFTHGCLLNCPFCPVCPVW